MPKFYEVLSSTDHSTDLKFALIEGLCQMSNKVCDGGGNRHQTKLNKTELETLYGDNAEHVNAKVPAVCSIVYEKTDEKWIVCPRRLFSFPKTETLNSNPVIKAHELEILNAIGVNKDALIGIYPEVYLKFNDVGLDAEINYHFDYVICELKEDAVTLGQLWKLMGLDIDGSEKEKRNIKKFLSTNGLIDEKATDDTTIKFFPDLESFAIVEVMTASTSGSNTVKGTDIKGSYIKMLNQKPYECPGINKRQVWGRMATQLFAKSALAHYWGAKTYWVVQEKLLENIQKTTKLEIHESETNESTINFIELSYDDELKNKVKVTKSVAIDAGINFNGSGNAIDILLAKHTPSKTDLLKSMIRSKLSATIKT